MTLACLVVVADFNISSIQLIIDYEFVLLEMLYIFGKIKRSWV